MTDVAMSAPDTGLRAEVEDLLFREAALLDRRDFHNWLKLFADDATYWIPSGADEFDPSQHVSLVYDRLAELRERTWRIDSGLGYAQEPASRTAHMVSNVETQESGSLVKVDSVFIVAEFRRDRQMIHAGRYRHHLRRNGESLLIVLKKVELINNDGYLGNLSLIL